MLVRRNICILCVPWVCVRDDTVFTVDLWLLWWLHTHTHTHTHHNSIQCRACHAVKRFSNHFSPCHDRLALLMNSKEISFKSITFVNVSLFLSHSMCVWAHRACLTHAYWMPENLVWTVFLRFGFECDRNTWGRAKANESNWRFSRIFYVSHECGMMSILAPRNGWHSHTRIKKKKFI